MGQMLPQYPLNSYTLLVLTFLKCMLFQQKNQSIQTPRIKEMVEIAKTWTYYGPHMALLWSQSFT